MRPTDQEESRAHRRLDIGTPLIVPADVSSPGWALFTHVCASRACPASTLHLKAGLLISPNRAQTGPESPRMAYDVVTRALRPESTVDVPPNVAAWVAREHDRLAVRFEHLAGQRAPRRAFRDRPPPTWTPGQTLAHADFFPHDFAPYLTVGDETWVIDDQACADPSCTCEDSVLRFVGPRGEHEASGKLGGRTTSAGSSKARALWREVSRDPELLPALRERRVEIRAASAWAVAAAYEADRRKRAPARGAPDPLLGALWDAGAALLRARPWNAVAPWMEVRVQATGALTFEGWLSLDGGEEDGIPELRLASEGAPLSVSFPRREDAPHELLAARLASDLPLLDDGRVAEAETHRGLAAEPAGPAEVRLLTAVARATADLADDLADLADRVFLGDEPVERTTLQRVVPTESGADVVVVLVAGEPGRGWAPPGHDGEAGGRGDDGGAPTADAGGASPADVRTETEDGLGAKGLDATTGRDDVRSTRRAGSEDDGPVGDDGPEEDALDDEELDDDEELVDGEELVDDDDGACGLALEAPSRVDGIRLHIAAIADRMRDRGIGKGEIEAMRWLLEHLGGVDRDDNGPAPPWWEVAPSFLEYRGRDALAAADGVPLDAALAGLDAAAAWLGEVHPGTEAIMTRLRTMIARAGEARAPRVRWRPAEDEAAPPATSPCPCGSGRRYKKCCMSR